MDYTAVQGTWQSPMAEVDPWLTALLEREEQRQFQKICLSAASSLCPLAVRMAQASAFSNIDAEGYPPKRLAQAGWEQLLDLDEQIAYYQRYGDTRYNKGTELANLVEVAAQRRAAAVFSTDWADNSDRSVSDTDIFVNLQCPTGSLANTAVFEAFLKPGDVVLSMNLVDGGHLSHGSPLHRSGKTYKIVHYGVDLSTQRLDYDQVRDLIRQHHPKLIVGGASSYPWAIDWKKFRQIAEESEPRPYVLADISHPAGLVAAGLIPNPIGYADAVTFTTYKTFCGPRGAAILSTDRTIAELIDRAVFPGLQSAPIFQQVVALAVAFEIARTQEFKRLQRKIAENARLLHQFLTDLEIPTAFGGTDTHIVIANVGKVSTPSQQRLTGDIVASLLERIGISCNSNLIPGDRYVALASGIRLGTTWISQLGCGEAEVREIASIIADVCKGVKLYKYYGLRREMPGGKVKEELLQSATRRVKGLLWKNLEQVGFSQQENAPDKNTSAQGSFVTSSNLVGRKDERRRLEALIVSGEHSASFLQSLVTRDIYALEPGEVFPTLILNQDGEKRFDILVQCLAGEPRPQFLLVYQPEPEIHLREWLQMLSDGFVEIEKDDPRKTLDGPIVIKTAGAESIDAALASVDAEAYSRANSDSLIEKDKPYFIGQIALPVHAAPSRSRFDFAEDGLPGGSSALSPLTRLHKAAGATFASFCGYDVPLFYTSSSQEHEQVRQNAGLFDLFHRELLGFRGQGAERFLDLVLSERISQLRTGDSCRTCILSPEGMLLSDCVLYRLAPDYFIMELEPVNARLVENWLRAVASGEVLIDLSRPTIKVDRNCSITNLKTSTDSPMILALQGPKSTSILQELLNKTENRSVLPNLRKGQITEFSLSGVTLWIARRGYTGESVGFELFVPQFKASFIWNLLMSTGQAYALGAIGLKAADSLRIEAGLPLYGKDLAGPYGIDPVEAGLGSSLKLDKPFFIGRQARLTCTPDRKMIRLCAEIDALGLVGSELAILNDTGDSIGQITSTAIVSGRFYGLALLNGTHHEKASLSLSYHSSLIPAETVTIPYSAVIEA
ncbi:MAG TPA: hypothetical protein VIZ18_13760 [Ktedonobacteraceae bacterium]